MDPLDNNDILGLQETQTDVLNDVQIDSFHIYHQRRSSTSRISGDNGFEIKETYANYAHLIGEM